MCINKPAKEKSVTLTFFTIGFMVALVKLLISGLTIHGMVMAPFSGSEFALVVGALGGIYAMRRMKNDTPKSN